MAHSDTQLGFGIDFYSHCFESAVLASQFMFVARTAHRERTMIMDIVAMVAFFRSFGLLCSKLAISPWNKIKVVHELL